MNQDKTSGIRLQKVLADRGIASRRRCAELIESGLIEVNGTISLEPGLRVDPQTDIIKVDGKQIPASTERHRTIMLHKPSGYICSTSDRDGRTIYELLGNISERLVPVGRLDLTSEGLLLMSNDGDLILRATHPRFEHEKTYKVTVSGKVDERVLEVLRSRMVIDGYKIQPASVAVLHQTQYEGQTVLRFILKEGRNRQVRKMCDQVGLKIHKLVRTAIGKLSITGLLPGQWRECRPEEIAAILKHPVSSR